MVKTLTAFSSLTLGLFFSAATQEAWELRIYLPIIIVSLFGLMEYDRQYRQGVD